MKITLKERVQNLINFANKYNLPIGCTSWGDLTIDPEKSIYRFMPYHSGSENYDLTSEWPTDHEAMLEKLVKSIENTCHSKWRHPPPYIDEEYPEVGYVWEK